MLAALTLHGPWGVATYSPTSTASIGFVVPSAIVIKVPAIRH